MSWSLPFKRGHYWPSNEAGGVPSGILGKTYLDPVNGNEIQVVKNTDASALAGCLLVKWENLANFEVDKVTASGEVKIAGVVDPAYAERGVTVPVNAAFIVVKKGRTHCIAGAVTAAGGVLISDAGASNLVEGRVQNGLISQSAAAAGDGPQRVFGVTYESGNAADSVRCMVNIP